VLFNRPEFKESAENYSEPTFWLLGPSSRKTFNAIQAGSNQGSLISKAYPDSGYYLLQCGRKGSGDEISVLFDCGDLGYKSIAAHGHSDALSFTLRAFGKDIFVDPGTYDYFSYPEWRNYFRSTAAHNTVVVDDSDQSVMLGAFMWGDRAKARCIDWNPVVGGGRVVGEQDGYARLGKPVVHCRTLDLDANTRTVTIEDEIISESGHQAAIYFQLSEKCLLSRKESNIFEIGMMDKKITLELDPAFSVEALKGGSKSFAGWVSHGYHQKVSSPSIVGSVSINASRMLFKCKIKI